MNALAIYLDSFRHIFLVRCQACALYLAGYTMAFLVDPKAAAALLLLEWCRATFAKTGVTVF